MTTHLLAFWSSLLFVGLKSCQQLNVVNRQYWWILPTSLLMSTFEVFVVVAAAKNGFEWALVFCIGGGAGLGATIATYLHHKFVMKGK